MPIEELAVTNYRSIKSLRVPLGQMTVVVGANGTGKTNLYRSMVLLAAAARGRLARTLLQEGGMPSVLFAGQRARLTRRKREPVRMRLEIAMAPVHYAIELGLPQVPPKSAFHLDPEVKFEEAWTREGPRKVVLAERKALTAWLRDHEGHREVYPTQLDPAESVLSQLKDPRRYPVLHALRGEFSAWRFYHHFPTHLQAPVRQRQHGVRTTVLSPDGSDLAAALRTIHEIGMSEDFDDAVDHAFPGASLQVTFDDSTLFEIAMRMPGVLRPLTARELSDGTLRYLCLLAVLLSPRPPAFLALNEPETSLHADLMEPLGAQIARAARASQILVCTHSERLAEAICAGTNTTVITLERLAGETEGSVEQRQRS